MKAINLTGLCALVSTLVAGCASYTTGLVAVDKEMSRENGFVVTTFDDNPFFANIYYDYTGFEKFDASRVNVSLMHTPLATKPQDDGYSEPDCRTANYNDSLTWLAMTAASNSDLPKAYHWKKRDAVIVKSEPGHVKLFSMDDIGTYVLSYAE